MRFRPEMALIRLGLAELLLEDSERAHQTDALGHLDAAIAEFRAMQMQAAIEQGLRHRAQLTA
ncbi:MAG TPA: hypothetical protein VIO16_12585 [Dehalococcoidia bacterium]